MSDIRTKILLGTTISAVSVMLVMAIGMVTQQEPTASSTLGIAGHFEMIVTNPDGTVSYVQTDNAFTGDGKEAIGGGSFGDSGAPGLTCTRLGTGVNDQTAEDLDAVLGTTGVACDADLTNNCPGGDATITVTDGAVCTVTTEHTLSTDCSPACLLTEASLNNAAGSIIAAHTGLSTDVVANEGADVALVYVAITGGTLAGSIP